MKVSKIGALKNQIDWDDVKRMKAFNVKIKQNSLYSLKNYLNIRVLLKLN